MWPVRSQSIKTKVQLKISNWLRLRLNVNSVIINQLKHICTHQHVISVINGLKKTPPKTHSQDQHGRIKFECNHCDHKANQRCNLKSHKGSFSTCTTSPSSSTQDLQVLPNYWLPFICPPPPQHEIQKLQALHPCCNSIILHFQEWFEKEFKAFHNVHIITFAIHSIGNTDIWNMNFFAFWKPDHLIFPVHLHLRVLGAPEPREPREPQTMNCNFAKD